MFSGMAGRFRPVMRWACRPQPWIRHNASYPPVRYRPGSGRYQRFGNNEPFYRSKRMWIAVGTGTVLYGGYYVTHLEKVPVSGRMRFMDVTPRQEEAMAKMAYQEVMAEYDRRILPPNHRYSLFVKRVARRLVQVSGMDDLQWEFHVIDSPELNAFVLPGGKVFVFTGILPVVQNEDGMAAVLGHEIAHQLARHSAEKLSFAKVLMAIQLTLSLFGIDPSFLFNGFTLNFLMMRPFSRKCETEADLIGLQLMAQACFDPQEAVKLWVRMESASGNRNVPRFVSTHPTHKNRIQVLEHEMPVAMAKREESDCSAQLHSFADQFQNMWVRW